MVREIAVEVYDNVSGRPSTSLLPLLLAPVVEPAEDEEEQTRK